MVTQALALAKRPHVIVGMFFLLDLKFCFLCLEFFFFHFLCKLSQATSCVSLIAFGV